MGKQHSLRDRLRARLGVEALEDRWTPALMGSPTFINGILTYRCDGANDNFVITDDGLNNVNSVQITLNGQPLLNASSNVSGITNVVIDTGDGDDSVIYQQTGTMQVTRMVNLELGRGRDTARLDIRSVASTGFLAFYANGGQGNDLLAATVNGRHDGRMLHVHLAGGDDNDTINIYAVNTVGLGSRMELFVFGEGGNDSVSNTYQGRSFGTLDLRTQS